MFGQLWSDSTEPSPTHEDMSKNDGVHNDFRFPPYDYGELQQDEIRLLELEQPTSYDDPVRCKMRKQRLLEKSTPSAANDEQLALSEAAGISWPKGSHSTIALQADELDHFSQHQGYAALSYAWGQSYSDGSHLTNEIICDGRALRVTETLYQALRRIAMHGRNHWWKSSSERLLWCDAVCINQLDTRERNSQVAMMGRIYKRATAVIVWLGEPDDDRSRTSLQHLYARAGSSVGRILDDSFVIDIQRELRLITRQAWQSRRWVFQEYTLGEWSKQSKYLLRGQHAFSSFGLFRLLEIYAIDWYDCKILMSIIRFQLQGDASMLHRLWDLDITNCSDPRDLLYSLLSTTTDCQWLRIDYQQSAEQLFTEFAIGVFERQTEGHQALALLVHAAARHEGNPWLRRLPSWVPDWRLKLFCETEGQSDCFYKLCSDEPRKPWEYNLVDYRIEGRILILKGWSFQCCFPPKHDGNHPNLAEEYNDTCPSCRTCQVFSSSWRTTNKAPWCRRQKRLLTAATANGSMLFIPQSLKSLIFVLGEPRDQDDFRTTYKLEHCFSWYDAKYYTTDQPWHVRDRLQGPFRLHTEQFPPEEIYIE